MLYHTRVLPVNCMHRDAERAMFYTTHSIAITNEYFYIWIDCILCNVLTHFKRILPVPAHECMWRVHRAYMYDATCTSIHIAIASHVPLLRVHWSRTTCAIHACTQIHVTCAFCVRLQLRCIRAHRYIWRLHRTCPCCEYIDHARHVRYMPAHKYMWRVHFVCAYNYDAYVHTDTYDDCIVRAIVARTMSTHDMYDTCPHTNTCDSCIVCVLTFTMHACSPIHSTIASCVQMFRVHWAHTTCTTQPGPECPRVCTCTLLCICACVLHMCVPACIHVCAIHANKLHIVTCDHCCIVRRLDIYRQIMIDIRAATFMCWRRHEVSFHTLSVWMR